MVDLMKKIKGSYTIAFTPFHEDGSIDYEQYLSKWMINPESLLAIEKEILVRRGILKSSYCRRPAYHLTEENSREIDQFLAEFAVLLKKANNKE